MQAIATQPQRLDVAPPYQLVLGRHGWMLCNLNDIYMGKAISTYGECCESEAQFLLQLAHYGGTVVEAGANMGIHTVPLGRFLATGGRKLLAFEPQPVIYQQLSANLALNGLTNVTAWPYACGAAAGTAAFPAPNYRQAGNFGAISMDGSGLLDSASVVTVPCVKVDDMATAEHVGLMKVDVEGFELNVLKGAAATIARCRPLLYVENDRVENSRDLIEWLWAAGYKLWWHAPRLFNPDNYFGAGENLYAKIVSLNMLGVPKEASVEVPNMTIVADSGFHPMLQRPVR